MCSLMSHIGPRYHATGKKKWSGSCCRLSLPDLGQRVCERVCVCVCACVCGAREGSCQEKLKSQLNVLQICSTKCESYLTKQVTKKWSRLLISVSQLFRLGWEGAAPESPWQFWADGLIIVEYYSRSWLTVPSRPLIGLDLHINAWVFWRLGGKQGFGFCSGGLSWQLKTSQFCSKSGCFGSEARLWVVMQEN